MAQRAIPTIGTLVPPVSLTKGGGPYVEPFLINTFPIEEMQFNVWNFPHLYLKISMCVAPWRKIQHAKKYHLSICQVGILFIHKKVN